jgi:hypothetical protein
MRYRMDDRSEEAAAAPSGGGDRRPWRWVAVGRGGGQRFADLIERGWLESDGHGRVRPTSMFPLAVAQALGAIG